MKKVQIIEKSCHREALKVERVRDFLRANDYELLKDDIGIDPTTRYAFPLQNLEIDPTADVIVLSTCGFKQEVEDADFEALKIIHKEKRADTPVIVVGCLKQLAPERLKREFKGSTYGPDEYERLDEVFEHKVSFKDVPEPNILKNTDNYFIQIQSGCNNRCSYCSIWRTIGKNNSKPLEKILDEITFGIENGYKHFYFLGHCAGAWGMDQGNNLSGLLKEIASIDGDFDIVLEDVSPKYYLKAHKELLNLCKQGKVKQFHTPIQSANDRILKLMNRKSGIMDELKEKLQELREVKPDISLSSSVILGFPSETEDELNETIDFCKSIPFDTVACHVFSKRPGAPAAEMENQHSEEELARRYNIFKEQFEGTTRVDPNTRPLVEGEVLKV